MYAVIVTGQTENHLKTILPRERDKKTNHGRKDTSQGTEEPQREKTRQQQEAANHSRRRAKAGETRTTEGTNTHIKGK